MANTWFKLTQFNRSVNPEAMLGTTEFNNEIDYIYKDRILKKNSSIIWVPSAKAHIGIASYVDACRNNDVEALKKLEELGIPKGINFGYGPKDDLSSTYMLVKDKKPRKKKADSVAVMRAKFGASFEDGTTFKAGEIVKILFRKKFVKENTSGVKRFENMYLKPTEEEISEFLKNEKVKA